MTIVKFKQAKGFLLNTNQFCCALINDLGGGGGGGGGGGRPINHSLKNP